MTLKNTMQIIEYPYTPIEIMSAIHDAPCALWLDSADKRHPESRWSFVMWDPAEVITYKDGMISHNGDCFAHDAPFDFVRERLEGFIRSRHPKSKRAQRTEGSETQESTQSTSDPSTTELRSSAQDDIKSQIPFTGGAAGYFGYDLGRTLETLPRQTQPSHTPDMMIGIYDAVYAYDHKEARGYWITYNEKKHLPDINQTITPAANIKAEWTSEKTQSQYEKDIQRIIAYIHAGEIYQANMTHRFEAPRPAGFFPFAHYLHLRDINAAPFAGYFNAGDTILSSASPERFIKCDADGRIETKPIKGTMPVSANPLQDAKNRETLLSSDKDFAENIMIVDLLRNDLSKCAEAHSVTVPKLCALESFAHVHHLVSTVTAQLAKDKDSIDLLKGSFPGGSITGAPKIRAQEIIEELETHSRGPYCGALGYIGFDGAMDTNILIRTLVIEGDRLHFNVGGGVVADSDPAAEYLETLDKAEGIFKSFAAIETKKDDKAA